MSVPREPLVFVNDQERPPPPASPFAEIATSIVLLFAAALIAEGILRTCLLGVTWIWTVVAFCQALPALLALAGAATAVLGYVGVDPERSLLFLALTLAGFGLLLGVLFVVVFVIGAIREAGVRIPRPKVGWRVQSPSPLSLHSAGGGAKSAKLAGVWPLSQYIVGLALRQMTTAERERWEEEMRRDVEDTFVLLRVIYALGIWRNGIPARQDDVDEGPESQPRRS